MEALYVQTLLQSQLEIQARALHFINKEIYDNIGQILSVAKLNLGVMKADDNNCVEKVVVTKDLIGKAIIDLRYLCEPLDPEKVIRLGLAKSIEFELKQLEKTTKFKYSFTSQIENFSLGNDELIIVFRMLQQLLEFSINYSNGKQILVQLNRLGDRQIVSVQTETNDVNIVYHLINSPVFAAIIAKANIIGAHLQVADSESNRQMLILRLVLPTN